LRKHYARHADKSVSVDVLEFKKDYVTDPVYAGEYKDVETILDAMPEKQKTIFTRMKIEGYTAQEVAKELDMSVSAVKVSAHRTLSKLKSQLQA